MEFQRENKSSTNDTLILIGFILFIVGIYMILQSVVTRRATRWTTRFVSALSVIALEGSALLTLYDRVLHPLSEYGVFCRWPFMPVVLLASLVIYVLCICQACNEYNDASWV